MSLLLLGRVRSNTALPDEFTWAPAVVQKYDVTGNPAGYGAADDPAGVFYGRNDLSLGDRWRVSSVTASNIIITPLDGGRWSYSVGVGGQSPGQYSFSWFLEGPEPTVGSKLFNVV